MRVEKRREEDWGQVWNLNGLQFWNTISVWSCSLSLCNNMFCKHWGFYNLLILAKKSCPWVICMNVVFLMMDSSSYLLWSFHELLQIARKMGWHTRSFHALVLKLVTAALKKWSAERENCVFILQAFPHPMPHGWWSRGCWLRTQPVHGCSPLDRTDQD